MTIQFLELTMPESLYENVFDGLNEEQKEAILTFAKCDSLMSYIEYSVKNAPENVSEALLGIAADVCGLAMTAVMNMAEVQNEEEAHALMDRAIKFTSAAKGRAEAAVKEQKNGTE